MEGEGCHEQNLVRGNSKQGNLKGFPSLRVLNLQRHKSRMLDWGHSGGNGTVTDT